MDVVMPKLLRSMTLSSFCVFAPGLESLDEDASLLERSQELLCFFPEMLPLEAKLRHLSTCKAAMSFAQQFKPTQAGVPARTATIALKRRRVYLRELEPGIWAALVVVAAEVAARPPNDGQEMSSSVAMRPSTPYAPAAPAGARSSLAASPAGRSGSRAAAARRSRASEDSASTRQSGSAVGSGLAGSGIGGSDYVQTATESEAQALIDSLYRRWTVLLGPIWACLGGSVGVELLAAGAAAMGRHRKLRDKLVRAHEKLRHSAAPPAELGAKITGLEAEMTEARAEAERLTAHWPLLALRLRLQRAVTWALWHADVTRLSALEARDGPVPCPMNPTSFHAVSELVGSVHRCHTGIEHVMVLWDGKVVVGSRHEHARDILGVLGWLAWDLLNGSPPLSSHRDPNTDLENQFWSKAPAPAASEEATEAPTTASAAAGDIAPGMAGFGDWEESMILRQLGVPMSPEEESVQWSQSRRSSAESGRVEHVMPPRDLQLMCKRVASTVQTHLPGINAALNDGVRVARMRADAEPFVQRHADMGAVGVFGELAVPQVGAYRGVTTAEAAKAMSLKGSLLASRVSSAAGWRVPPPCRHSAQEGLWAAPGHAGSGSGGREGQSFASALIADAVAASDGEVAHAAAVLAEHEAAEREAAASGDHGAAAAAAAAGPSMEEGRLSAEHRLHEWALQRQHWALVGAAHWPSMGGGGAADKTVDVPANYDSPDALVQAVDRVTADARNATSVAVPVDPGVVAAMPVAHSGAERLEFTRRAGGAVSRREGYREVTMLHVRSTPQIANVTKTAGALLGPRFRHLYV